MMMTCVWQTGANSSLAASSFQVWTKEPQEHAAAADADADLEAFFDKEEKVSSATAAKEPQEHADADAADLELFVEEEEKSCYCC